MLYCTCDIHLCDVTYFFNHTHFPVPAPPTFRARACSSFTLCTCTCTLFVTCRYKYTVCACTCKYLHTYVTVVVTSNSMHLNYYNLGCELASMRPKSVTRRRNGIAYRCSTKRKVQKCTPLEGPTALKCSSKSRTSSITFRCVPRRRNRRGNPFKIKMDVPNDISCI